MVRFSDNTDFPAMRKIWDACFPDDKAFAETFFNSIYRKALVFEQNGNVTAMLHLLPFTRSDGVPVTYIYAVGTLPEYRKLGQSAALIKEALSICDTCILIPGEPWLFGFYEKFGFRTVFFRHKFTTPPLEKSRKATADDIPMLNSIYCEAVEPRLERDPEHWNNYLNEIMVFDKGYAILSNKCVIEAFGIGMSSVMTDLPYGMANKWIGENTYLGAMYD